MTPIEAMGAVGGFWAVYTRAFDPNARYLRGGEGCQYGGDMECPDDPPLWHPDNPDYHYAGMLDLETGQIQKGTE